MGKFFFLPSLHVLQALLLFFFQYFHLETSATSPPPPIVFVSKPKIDTWLPWKKQTNCCLFDAVWGKYDPTAHIMNMLHVDMTPLYWG